MNDNAECRQLAINDNKIKKEQCDSSLGQVAIGQGGEIDEINRRKIRCSITFTAQENDNGKWKCTLHKCMDTKNGGCSSNIASNCSSEAIVDTTVCISSFQ